MILWDRQTGKYIKEQEYKKSTLTFLYETIPGRLLLKVVVIRPWFSKLYAYMEKSRFSVKRIAPFIEKYEIDLSQCEKTQFTSFDDFFTRKKKCVCLGGEQEVIAIADARLSVYKVREDMVLHIKNSSYTLEELTGGFGNLSKYQNGFCLVYRLAVEDYHRYVFCDDGCLKEQIEIPGVLHTVRPVSEKYKVYSRNHRVCSLLQTKSLGEVVQIEIGALLIGKIHNHPVSEFAKFQEKGYFSYGGSTIVQLFEADQIELAKDIMKQSEQGNEVRVRIGEVIGRAR